MIKTKKRSHTPDNADTVEPRALFSTDNDPSYVLAAPRGLNRPSPTSNHSPAHPYPAISAVPITPSFDALNKPSPTANRPPNALAQPEFIRTAPDISDLGLTSEFYALPQAGKDKVIDDLVQSGAFAMSSFHGAPHIFETDKPAGLIAIWHSKSGAVVAHDPVTEKYHRRLAEDSIKIETAVMQMHRDKVSQPGFKKELFITNGSFARELKASDQPALFGSSFMAEYGYLQDTFKFAIGRDPRRRHSIKVQMTEPGEKPVMQHTHLDRTLPTKTSPAASVGFIQIKTVHGTDNTEVILRPLSKAEYKDATKRRSESDSVATELGAIQTPPHSICMVKAFSSKEIDYDVAAAHRFPTVHAGAPRLSIGMVE